jgi:hypothetical protein
VQNGYFVEKESKKAIEQNFVIRKRVPRQMLKDRKNYKLVRFEK